MGKCGLCGKTVRTYAGKGRYTGVIYGKEENVCYGCKLRLRKGDEGQKRIRGKAIAAAAKEFSDAELQRRLDTYGEMP